MLLSFCSFPQRLRWFGLIVVAGVVLASCGPTTNNPASQTGPYDRAKDAFKSGQLDKALDLTDKLATATPPADSTDRARVLRAVIYTGELKSGKELAEAYSKGADKAKNPRFQAEYRRLHNDSLANAAKAALNLAETAHQIAPDGVIAKELTLDASYPTTEGPPELKARSTSKRVVGLNLTSKRARRRIRCAKALMTRLPMWLPVTGQKLDRPLLAVPPNSTARLSLFSSPRNWRKAPSPSITTTGATRRN